MNTISTIRILLQGAFLVVFIPAVSLPALAATAGGTTANSRSAHSTQTMPAALQPVFYEALAKDAGAAYDINKAGCAVLQKQSLKACFDNRGAHFTGNDSALALHLIAFGRTGALSPARLVQPSIEGNQARYRHGNLSEWWRVLPVGFEQGFTIAKRPGGHGQLTLTLAASRQDAGAPIIRQFRAGGNPVKASPLTPLRAEGGKELAWGKLRYGELVVTDAKGKVVPATLTNKGDRVLIAVNDAHADYPLTVDPLVRLEQKVTAGDGAEQDVFGNSVALDGTTAVVGAPEADVNGNDAQGAAYVFSKSGGTWTQTVKLTSNDGAAFDEFGFSVALDGSTVLVGAVFATVNGHADQGAAYVFTESGSTWTQTAKLTASDGAKDDRFGGAVALDGTTALVGAFCVHEDPFTFVCGPGAAYVFTNSGGIWSETQELTASDGADDDGFGSSVVLDGPSALVGAPQVGNGGAGAAYVFAESGGVWSETQKLTASDGAAFDEFGRSVALDATTALVVADDAAVNGNVGQGAAYVFAESGGSWSETTKLTASDGAANNHFGSSVALDGSTALVGAFQAAVNDNFGQGAVYVFGESGGTWAQTAKLTASDGATFDEFGSAVALDGATGLVGAPAADVNGNFNQGAAYFYNEDADLSLVVAAPNTVFRFDDYVAQAFATNNATVTAAAVIVTVAVPAAASFVSAVSTQGDCDENSGTITCNFGPIGAGGFAVASVTLEATGNGGSTIDNTASISNATPKLTDAVPTRIHACPQDYLEYDGTLVAGARDLTQPYQSPAGKQAILFSAPPDFALFVGYRKDAESPWTIRRIAPHAAFQFGPAGTYRWGIQAGSGGGDYTLCIQHP